MARILITSAIPYINGIKHLGNLVGSQLPADLFARYMRGRGHEVMFICATDEHGTPAELAAIEAGAQDVTTDDGVTFFTDPTDLDAVQRALPNFGYTVQKAYLGYRAKNPVTLSGSALEEVEAFLEALDNHDDVQNVYVGLSV